MLTEQNKAVVRPWAKEGSKITDITAVRAIEVACRKEDALAVVWEIKNIEKSEVKADLVIVNKETEKKGTYNVRGHFAGIPWHNTFSYELNEKGFHSVEAYPPASGSRIQGGFIVEETGENSCNIIHYEQYVIPLWLVPLKPFIQMYLLWSMKKELRDVRELIFENAGKAAV
jgi:hypothetical protein